MAKVVAAKQHRIPLCGQRNVMLKISAIAALNDRAKTCPLLDRCPSCRCTRKGPILLRLRQHDRTLFVKFAAAQRD
jgi:hypothetical protein